MDAPDTQQAVETAAPEPQQIAPRRGSIKPRSVHPCNFRSAGRLSNENARALTTLHETFARHLSIALANYLGRDLKVKLLTLDQMSLRDHIAGLPEFTYLMPFAEAVIPSSMIVEFDLDVAFPMIDLLLGGTGLFVDSGRDLSEIEEIILHDLAAVIARQGEEAWGLTQRSLKATRRIDSQAMSQFVHANEKVTLVSFEIEMAGLAGSFQVAFPTSFVNYQVKLSKAGEPQKKTGVRQFPAPSIRERIQDCDVVVAADLLGAKVAVRDLVALQPGSVLKLRAPVRDPGMLTIAGRELFEAVPVRNGGQKAVQIGQRVQLTSFGKE